MTTALVFQGVTIRRDDNFVDLTDMWRAAGSPPNRKPYDWRRTDLAKKYIVSVGEKIGAVLDRSDPDNPYPSLFRPNSGGVDENGVKGGGSTMAHVLAALPYAHYLNTDFYVWFNNEFLVMAAEKKAAAEILTPIARAKQIAEVTKACSVAVNRLGLRGPARVVALVAAVKAVCGEDLAKLFGLTQAPVIDVVAEPVAAPAQPAQTQPAPEPPPPPGMDYTGALTVPEFTRAMYKDYQKFGALGNSEYQYRMLTEDRVHSLIVRAGLTQSIREFSGDGREYHLSVEHQAILRSHIIAWFKAGTPKAQWCHWTEKTATSKKGCLCTDFDLNDTDNRLAALYPDPQAHYDAFYQAYSDVPAKIRCVAFKKQLYKKLQKLSKTAAACQATVN